MLKIIEILKKLLNSQAFLGAIQDGLLKLLKAQMMGGFRGWLIKLLVREFSEEVIEVTNNTLDYITIVKKVKDTVNAPDRDQATTDINDIMY